MFVLTKPSSPAWLRWAERALFYGMALLLLALGGAVAALRWWILPDIDAHRSAIEAQAGAALGQQVSIGAIEGRWHGLRPYLAMRHLVVRDGEGHERLRLERVSVSLSWTSLLTAELRTHRIEIVAPWLDIRREADGLIYVSGLAVNDPAAPRGFGEWLLRQEEIRVSGATVEWRDHLRAAPPLVLREVSLKLESRGNRHRFGLRATPPPALASVLDLRGDLRGTSLNRPEGWSGTLYADLGFADVDAWRPWVRLPYAIDRGRGALELWLDFAHGHLGGLTAMTRLENVRARLAADLPLLDVESVSGRLQWRRLPRGFAFEAKSLAFNVADRIRVPASNVLVEFQAAGDGQPERGRVRADRLTLSQLAGLTAYLPLTAEERQRWAELDPRGRIERLALEWQGPHAAPQRYNARADFDGLALRPWGLLPGFGNISGTLEANEKGGRVTLNGRASSVDMPRVMRHRLGFDSLNVSAHWRVRDDRVEVTVDRASFANRDLAGSVSGAYRTVPGQAGYADLSATLTRAAAPAVYQYVPQIIGEDTYTWLKGALVAGRAEEVRIRVKGDLERFPFADDRDGLFEAVAKARDVRLQYAHGWPPVEALDATIDFHGKRMEITSSRGQILGVRLARVKAVIPDLIVWDEILELEGDAQGPTQQLLRFINASPVSAWTHHFTRDMIAAGEGKLGLALRMPLRRSDATTVSGVYRFANNQLRLDPDAPPLEQLAGRIAFTERSITVPRVSGQLLGGPFTLEAKTAADGAVTLKLAGRATAAALQQSWPTPLTQRLQGEAAWSANVVVHKGQTRFAVSSDLVGLALQLPAPLNKAAAQRLPSSFERSLPTGDTELMRLKLGELVAAQVERRIDGGVPRMVRIAAAVGAAEMPGETQPGTRINVNLPALDLDAWLWMLDDKGDRATVPPLATVRLRTGTLSLLERPWRNVDLRYSGGTSGWQASVASDEITGGELSRRGEGRIVVRAKRLRVPQETPAAQSSARPGAASADWDAGWPGFEVVVDSLETDRARYGRLEVSAERRGQTLQLEQLKLTGAHGSLTAKGTTPDLGAAGQTRVSIDLDVKDVGKYLADLGYPDEVRGATASLTGSLNWRGRLTQFNLASLGGELKLEVGKGQFLKAQPGVGRLLGLMSLQSLPRRLTLDFRDVFSEGFAFDTITASMKLKDGNISTQDLVMVGPGASVTMVGSVNVVNETQDLRVKVIPSIGDSVAVAGAFAAGPAVGVAALVLQRLLKDPVGQMISYDYRITGSWDNPVVTKIPKLALEPAP